MAVIFDVVYPNGEHAHALGLPLPGSTVVVDQVPAGPEACYRDVIEIEFTGPWVHRVVRIVGGPRRPTIRVRLPETDEGRRDAWMNARDREGWATCESPDDPHLIFVVATREGLAPASLEVDGAVILRSGSE